MMQPHVIILIVVALAFIPEVIWIVKLFQNKAQDGRLPKLTLRVNIIVFAIGVILTGITVLYDVNYLKYKSPMDYSKWEQITWSDFRAIKRPRQTLQSTFAFITTEIKISEYSDRVNVTTFFHPARSYTFSEQSAGQDLLTHELYHLHLSEYVAREIRQLYSDPNMKDVEFVNSYQKREDSLQAQYDEETAHGYLLGQQRRWQSKIDSCLKSLQEYANPEIKLK
jgi:hypothetical protein